MGRKSAGWRIRQKHPGAAYTAVFWHPGEKRQVEPGTGTSDPERAKQKAAQLYAEAIRSGATSKRTRGKRCVDGPLATTEFAEEWLDEASGWLDAGTIADYAMRFKAHIVPVFPSVLDFTTEALNRFIKHRLKVVQASTVRKDLSAVNGLLGWCKESKRLSYIPEVPGVPKRVMGTTFKRPSRASAPELSPEEIRSFLAELPDISERASTVDGFRFLVRPRFEFGYEMGLRPATLDRLSIPEHWAPGSKVLRIPARSMKQRTAVVLPLTARAREILEFWSPRRGLIWGAHDYRHQIEAAAKATIPEEKQQAFCAAHLRSARLTHDCDAGMSPTAVQWRATHASMATTARYVRPSQRAAEAEMRRLGML